MYTDIFNQIIKFDCCHEKLQSKIMINFIGAIGAIELSSYAFYTKHYCWVTSKSDHFKDM